MSKYSAIRINSISVPNFTAWLSAKGTERPGMDHQSTTREGMKQIRTWMIRAPSVRA